MIIINGTMIVLLIAFSLRLIQDTLKKTKFTEVKLIYMYMHWSLILVHCILFVTLILFIWITFFNPHSLMSNFLMF